MRWVWVPLVPLLVAAGGCSLDAIGLEPFGPGGLDSSLPDDGIGDVTPPPNDATITPDGAPGTDATTDATGDAPIPTADAGSDTGIVDATTTDALADAGPILTITGGTYDLFDQDAGGCSSNGGNSINFSMTNLHGSSVDLYWVNFQCGETKYATIANNGVANQQTYVNHVWRVRTTSGQTFLAEFRLTSQNTYTVTVH
jgi:hypothetical protein